MHNTIKLSARQWQNYLCAFFVVVVASSASLTNWYSLAILEVGWDVGSIGTEIVAPGTISELVVFDNRAQLDCKC